MNNAFDEIRSALAQARAVDEACNNNVNAMAELMDGRLRHVSPWRLKRLKKELRDFNIHTGKWKA